MTSQIQQALAYSVVGYEGGRPDLPKYPAGWGAAAILDETDPSNPLLVNGVSGHGSRFRQEDLDEYSASGVVKQLPYRVPVPLGSKPVVLDLSRSSAYIRYLVVNGMLGEVPLRSTARPDILVDSIMNEKSFFLIFKDEEQFDRFVAAEVIRIFKFVIASTWMRHQLDFPYVGQPSRADIECLIRTAVVLSCHDPWATALSALEAKHDEKTDNWYTKQPIDLEMEIASLRSEASVTTLYSLVRTFEDPWGNRWQDMLMMMRNIQSGLIGPDPGDPEGRALLEKWRKMSVRMLLP